LRLRRTRHRQVLGLDVAPPEDRAFWKALARSVVNRGLHAVRLVSSNAHEGLKQAIATALSRATWQRCRVHFVRSLLATATRGMREAIADVVGTIFAQPDHTWALAQARKVAEKLRVRFRGRRPARGRGRGHPRVPLLSPGAPTAAAQCEHVGTAEQGDQAPCEGRRDLPESGRGDPLGRRNRDRAGGRMGRRAAPLFQHRLHAGGNHAGAVEHGAGESGGYSVTDDAGWAALFRPPPRQRPRRSAHGGCGRSSTTYRDAPMTWLRCLAHAYRRPSATVHSPTLGKHQRTGGSIRAL
jgi:hypothetical protein